MLCSKSTSWGGDELLSLLVTVKVGVVNLCEGLTLDFLRIGLTITIITFKDTCPKGGVLRLGIEDYAIEVEKSCLKHFIHHFF